MRARSKVFLVGLGLLTLRCVREAAPMPTGIYYPDPGQGIAHQARRAPADLGLRPEIVTALERSIVSGRWALWRHGYLAHLEGDFNATSEVKSLRKVVLAAMVGASIGLGRIRSVEQPVGPWNPELAGADAGVTWFELLTQSSGLHASDSAPGEVWAYHDANPLLLSRSLARLWGRRDHADHFDRVLRDALLAPIGARGWSTEPREDGIRLALDLEDLGRLGLLLAAEGSWRGAPIVPATFARELATKQTYGVAPDYEVEADFAVAGVVTGLDREQFPESPFGYMCWVNTDGDLWPGASRTWALAYGSGGHFLAWDRESGLVFAMLDGRLEPVPGAPSGWPLEVRDVLETIDANVTGPNPLVTGSAPADESQGSGES